MGKVKKYLKKASTYYSENSTGTKFLINFATIFIIGLLRETLLNLFGFWLSILVVLFLIFFMFTGFSYGVHAWRYRKR